MPIEIINWKKVSVIFIGLIALGWLISRINHKRMIITNKKVIKQAEERVKAGISPEGGILPFAKEKLEDLEKQLTYFCPIISKDLINELKVECIRVYKNNQPPVKLKEIADKIYKPLIEDRLRYLGANPSNYTAGINNLLARIYMRLGREEINLKNLYAQEIKEFEDWSNKFGHRFKWTNAVLFEKNHMVEGPNFSNKDNILTIVLFRLVFDESIEFKATCPSFRYFLFDKSLKMLISGQKDTILKEIQNDTWALLEALRPGYTKELQLTKESIFTYEDVEDLFKDKKKGFLQAFSKLTGQTKEQKLNYLANNKTHIKNIKNYKNYTWLKTYSDKQGLLQFIINLSRLWAPLIPLFIAVFAAGILMGLKSLPLTPQLNTISSFLVKILSPIIKISISKMNVFLQVSILLGTGISAAALLLKLTLGGFKFTEHTFEHQITAKRAMRRFWLLFVPAACGWSTFNIFITKWATVVIFKSTFLNNGWGLFIEGGIAFLLLLFVVGSFYSLFYVIISIFAYFEGKREGVGQITNWAQIKKNFKKSKERFIDVMIPCKSKISLVSKEKIWKKFWNTMIEDLYKYHKLNDDEKKRLLYSQKNTTPNFNKKPANPEAQERIQLYINSWLMETPKVEFWTDLPTLTAMITAFNEPVSNSFDELNSSDHGATETRLNHLISRYPTDWNEFVNRLSEKDLEPWITKDKLRKISGLRKLPENLPVHLKEKIKRWANIITQPLEKTIIEVSKIRDAFMLYARVCYPKAKDEDIEKMVNDKIQILLNYEGYHKPFTRDEDRVALRKLMKEFPHLEVYWDSVGEDYVSGEGQDRFKFKKGTDGGLHHYNPKTEKIELFQHTPQTTPPKVGKPTGLSQIFPFIRGELVLFFDANAAVRIEDAVKIPMALSEFNNDPALAEVIFSEYIYPKNFSWVSQTISFNDETFTSITQRVLNLFGACGFYGHSAIIKTDVISSSGGIPQDYVSEDIMLAIAMWLKGFRTTHKEYLMFGKGRETSFYTALVPFIKWATGASEIALGRITPCLLQSKQLHYAQKIMLMFGFSFYYHIPFVLLINFLYLWLMVCWGVNAFMSMPFPYIFTILGLMFNQSIASMSIAYLIERYGFWKSLRVYINLVGKNFLLYTAAIPTYALGFIRGLKGKIKLAISSKGWNLGHIPFKTIWGKERIHLNAILVTTLIVIPILFVLATLEVVPFWISPFIAFVPLLTVTILYGIGVIGSRLGLKFLEPLRDEIVPEGDFTKISAIKTQIIFSIGLIAFLGIGLIMWGVLFSSLASKILFLLSILYICPPLSYILVPILAHSQPLLIFKEITISKLWNYFIIPLISVFCLIGIGLTSLKIIEVTTEVIMYLSFGIITLSGWILLKWRLSAYDLLDRWMRKNVPSYKKSSTILKSDLQDNIYFSHQELMGFEKDKRMSRLLRILLILLATTIPIVFMLYVLSEFEKGFYSSWLWLIIAVEIISYLSLSLVNAIKEKNYLKDLIDKIDKGDLYKLNEDPEFIDNIWQRLNLRYKDVLIEIYNDEKRAKEVLANYLSSMITMLGYDLPS
ncbi:MAG: hypothetical protein DRP84_09690 [Spirochaetes bacterium]|nr:MAG: hypothetical protein DRP84_09690 [Spirochaetota bacterium]